MQMQAGRRAHKGDVMYELNYYNDINRLVDSLIRVHHECERIFSECESDVAKQTVACSINVIDEKLRRIVARSIPMHAQGVVLGVSRMISDWAPSDKIALLDAAYEAERIWIDALDYGRNCPELFQH
jgi:hypothetical protein